MPIVHCTFTSKIQLGQKGRPEDTVYGSTSCRSLMIGSIKSVCSSFIQNLFGKPANKIIGQTSEGKSLMKSQEGHTFLPFHYHQGGIIELEVYPNETLGWMTLHPLNTNILRSIINAKSLYPHDIPNTGQKKVCSKRIWLVPPDSSKVSHKCIVTVVEFGRSHHS